MANNHRASRRIVAVLFTSQSLLSAALIIAFTVASITAVELAGGNRQWTGVPSTVLLVGAAVIAYPVGRLMDRAGRRVGLSLGHVLGVSGAAVAGFAVVIQSLPVFLLGALLLGFARGAVELGRYAAAEVSPRGRRGRAVSLVVLGGTVGSIAGPSLITLATRLEEWLHLPDSSGAWLVAAGFFVIGALLLFVFLRPDPRLIGQQFADDDPETEHDDPAGRSLRTLLRTDPRMPLAVGAMVFSQLAMVVVMTITPVHMDGNRHGLESISLVIMAHTLGMFGFSFVTGWLVDRVGRLPIILAGSVISTIACAIAPFSDSRLWLAAALFLLGFGWNFSFVAGSTLLDDLLRQREKGRVQGAVDSVVKVASGAGSLSSGMIFASLGFALTSWITIGAAIIPALLTLLLGRGLNTIPAGKAAAD